MSRRWIVCVTLLAACGDNVDEAPLTTIVQAGPSATCPDGGSLIESGVDTNGDGMLGSAEITTTQEICNGITGGSGASGSSSGSLVTVDNQVGSNCPLGGTRIQSGQDTNGDGVLEASEVTSTQYICSELAGSAYYVGDLTIGSAADLAVAQQYGAVIGNVFVLPSFSGDLSWPGLVLVTDTFDVFSGAGSALTIELPGLDHLEDLEVLGRGGFTSLTADALHSASTIDIEDNADLTTVSLAALARMDEDPSGDESFFSASNDNSLTSLTVPNLVQVDELDVDDDAVLPSLDLESLSAVNNYLGISSDAALTTLTLPILSFANYLTINFDGLLTTVTLPSLSSAEYFIVYDNDTLAAVSVPELSSLYYLDIHENPELPTCDVLAIEAGIVERSGALPGVVYNYSNDDSGTCAEDPCVPETFADISGATFEFCFSQLDWSDAETYCETTFSGALATFGSDAEWESFRSDALGLGWFASSGTVWLGYTDAADEGTWVPPDGVTAGYEPATDDSTFWSTGDGEPNGGTTENCTEFPEDDYVNDLSCTSLQSFVCRH